MALKGNVKLEAAGLRCTEKELSMTAKNPSLRLQPSEWGMLQEVWSVSTHISELKSDVPPGYSCLDSLLWTTALLPQSSASLGPEGGRVGGRLLSQLASR